MSQYTPSGWSSNSYGRADGRRANTKIKRKHFKTQNFPSKTLCGPVYLSPLGYHRSSDARRTKAVFDVCVRESLWNYWTLSSKDKLECDTPERTWEVQERTLRKGTIKRNTTGVCQTEVQKSQTPPHKYCFHLMLHLIQLLNFKYSPEIAALASHD